jgi:hypothetical protein
MAKAAKAAKENSAAWRINQYRNWRSGVTSASAVAAAAVGNNGISVAYQQSAKTATSSVALKAKSAAGSRRNRKQ